MSQTVSSDTLTPRGDPAQGPVTQVPNSISPHPLSVIKPRARTNKEEEEEIIREVVRFIKYLSSAMRKGIIPPPPPPPPILYSKTGVYRDIHYFSYFCSKTYIVDTH